MTSRFEKVTTVAMLAVALAVGGKYLLGANADRTLYVDRDKNAKHEPRTIILEGVALPRVIPSSSVAVTEFIDVECP